MSNWPQTTRAFIRTKLYSVYVPVTDYLPYFVFFLHLKKVLNRNRTPSCSAVTDICWNSLWLSLLCQEGIQKPTQWLMYHECDKGNQKPTQWIMYHVCDRPVFNVSWLWKISVKCIMIVKDQCLMYHDCERSVLNVSWLWKTSV